MSGKSKIKLKNGSWSNPKGYLFGSTELKEESVLAVENSGQSRFDAVLVLSVGSGGTADEMELHVVKINNGSVQDLAFAKLGDRTIIKNINIENETIKVNMLIHTESDPMCCPTKPVERIYTIKGTVLQPQITGREKGQILENYVDAMTKRSSLQIAMTMDPSARGMVFELAKEIKSAQADEDRIWSQIIEYGLMKDREFRALVADKINYYKRARPQLSPGQFSSMPPGERRAYLLLGNIRSMLEAKLDRK
jgi:hypothetical protein